MTPQGDRGRVSAQRGHLRFPRDRGSVAIETVLVVPVVMVILFLVVQFALWAHAAQVAQLAASEGDRSARSLGGTPAAGMTRAQSILQGPGSDLATSNVVVAVLPGDLVRITVTGRAVTILPGMSLPVSAVQIGPIQEFRGSE
jgi:Flp pilus assembly protein TadG